MMVMVLTAVAYLPVVRAAVARVADKVVAAVAMTAVVTLAMGTRW